MGVSEKGEEKLRNCVQSWRVYIKGFAFKRELNKDSICVKKIFKLLNLRRDTYEYEQERVG